LGGLGSLTAYRPYFLAFAVAALGWTFYRHYRNRISAARAAGHGLLAALRPSTAKDYRLLLGAALVAALMTFPQWGRPLVAPGPGVAGGTGPRAAARNPCGGGANPCAAKNPCKR